jgi:hypothetical protein
MKKIAGVMALAMAAIFFAGCSKSNPASSEKVVKQDLAAAKVIGDAYRAAPEIFQFVSLTSDLGRTKIVITRGVNDLKDSVTRKADVFFDQVKVYGDTSDYWWFGVAVLHAKIGTKEAVIVAGGRTAYYGFYPRIAMILDGQVINLLPEEFEYAPYKYEAYPNEDGFFSMSCACFGIKQGENNSLIIGLGLGTIRAFGVWNYWLIYDMQTSSIKEYGPDGSQEDDPPAK